VTVMRSHFAVIHSDALSGAVDPDDGASLQAQCSILAGRIAAARLPREYHLREALRVLPSLSAAREIAGFRQFFRGLMEHESFDAARRTLIAAANPEQRIDQLHLIDGLWVAVLVSSEGRLAVARHPDRVGALIAALIK